MQPQRSLSSEFVFLDNGDIHDVLSLPDSASSEDEPGSEGSRGAAAVIEALEEAPARPMQGLLPHFLLGGWSSSSSSPAAAGHTFTADLDADAADDDSAVVTDADTAAADAAAATQPAAAAEEPAAAASQQANKPAAVWPAPAVDSVADDAAAAKNSTPAGLGRAALLCLGTAATLATLVLLLLGAAAGGTGSTSSSLDRRFLMPAGTVPAFHTTSTDAYKAPANSHHFYSSRGFVWPGADRLSALMMPAAGATGQSTAATPETHAPVPWWLGFNSSSSLSRRAGARTGSTLTHLPPLPPSLQLVVDGSARANISASQRLRLHLWLLHCAARNTGFSTQQQQHHRLAQAGRQALNTSNARLPFRPVFAAAARRPYLARPIPWALQCAPSGTAQGWAHPASTSTSTSTSNNNTNNRAATTAGTFCTPAPSALLQPGAYAGGDALAGILSFVQPFNRSTAIPRRSSSVSVRVGAAAASSNKAGCRAGLCFSLACSGAAAAAAAHNTSAGHGTSMTQQPFARHASTAAEEAPAAAATSARVIVQPTRPVPPLYRPPLPCLLLGRRTPAATWPNSTVHRQQQGFAASRGWSLRSTKPYGRALAMSMARWGWHQEAAQRGGASPAHTMLLPSVAASTAQPAGANRTSSSSGSDGGKTAAAPFVNARAVGGVTLPMLPPVAQQQQRQCGSTGRPQASASGSSSSSSDTCSAGDEFSAGLILVHRLEPPTAATAAAAVNSAVQRAQHQQHHQQQEQQQDAAGSVAAIKRQLDPSWLYDVYDYEEVLQYAERAAGAIRADAFAAAASAGAFYISSSRSAPLRPAGGCVTGCANLCHGAATLCSELCVDKCLDDSEWELATAIPLPPAQPAQQGFVPAAATAVVPLAGPLCVKNTSWGFAAGAAAGRGRRMGSGAASAKSNAARPGSLLFPPVLHRNNTSGLLLPDVAAAAAAAASAAAAQRCTGLAVSDASSSGAETGWVASLITLPMLPPTPSGEAASPDGHRCQGAARLWFNATSSGPTDGVSHDKPVMPLWLSPIM